jgi:hypothetical protein
MIKYCICNQVDDEIFKKQCKALEDRIPTLKKDDLLLDVDGSETQIYKLNDEKVLVHNSYYLDEVYVESEVDLTKYFE